MSGYIPEIGPIMERRDFLKTMSGIVVVIAVGDVAAIEDLIAEEPQQRAYPTDLNAYLRISPDGRVTVFSGKIEMGQGVTTSLAQMAAEELGVDIDAIDMVMGDTATCPYDAGTWGSLTTRVFGPAFRAAAAEARQVLLQLASERLSVPVERLRVANGAVEVAGNPAQKIAFGQLADGKRIERVLDRKAVLTAVRDYRVMGQPIKRLEAVSKVTGAARYAGDVTLPGMLRARLLRPPAHGASRRRIDTSAARRVPGVVVVEQDDVVAVLHEDPEQAEKALALIAAEYDEPISTLDDVTIHDHLVKALTEESVRDAAGDLTAGAAASVKVFENTYLDGYAAHAPIETHTALADVKDGRATLWVSTQSPFGDQQRVAQALGFAREAVRVITPQVGGGFGGKSSNPQAIEAARLSLITGRPVQVMWTRAEEFFLDTFHAASVVKIRSGVDSKGRITFWDYRVYGAGARGSEVLYAVPNRRIASYAAPRGGAVRGQALATGPWRAPGANTNTFARESQIDIMAAYAQIDPLEFRLRNATDARLLSVLRAVADRYSWKPAALPSKRGLGVACGMDAGTYVAHISEVAVDRTSGVTRVKHALCAQEMGIVVNPEGATLQMEGCMTMGLGYALAEQIHFKGGRVIDRNFGTYQIPRFSWLPELDTVLVKNDELAPQGGGEPAIICMGASIANAIFDATGARVLSLPLSAERVRAALPSKAATGAQPA
ncbi:MAG TPA: molybdopterin cofactor-binding domain-containing protein [Longimicrobiales bacterium]